MQAAEVTFDTCKVGEVAVKLETSGLITMSAAPSASEADGVQLNEPSALHFDNIFEVGDDRDAGHEENI